VVEARAGNGGGPSLRRRSGDSLAAEHTPENELGRIAARLWDATEFCVKLGVMRLDWQFALRVRNVIIASKGIGYDRNISSEVGSSSQSDDEPMAETDLHALEMTRCR
jgi:hypothetical protein